MPHVERQTLSRSRHSSRVTPSFHGCPGSSRPGFRLSRLRLPVDSPPESFPLKLPACSLARTFSGPTSPRPARYSTAPGDRRSLYSGGTSLPGLGLMRAGSSRRPWSSLRIRAPGRPLGVMAA
ncbi:hypothetical protein P170DRAFT_49053 [Aspergillus steynii IBT 23096]|uniref:Uncharacterized protein n=1 Tax=Aspergillus steynii IBT 23096 TaxID=1392250 RepID=A0A2I2GS89_9EURO|nr:uncharacterized protein P170DRAFT_49053 [Aspergillus steynii IBT 23096]PLB55737.1 hypothetical protein P170DRAFT_49053 [Aspergillus steynii IBT 23096]